MIIKVNGKRLSGFSNYNIKLKYNAIASSFSFNAVEKIIPNILGFPSCEIIDPIHGRLLTGTILAPNLKDSPEPELTQIFGYSKTGILEDCTVGPDNYPLQMDNLTFREIATKLCTPFSVEVVSLSGADDLADEKIKQTIINPDQTIKDFLTTLALQKGLILSNDTLGRLLIAKFTRSSFIKGPSFTMGQHGIKAMNLGINTQKMHSSITIVKQASDDNPDAGEHTINNPYVSKYRPIVKVLKEGDLFDAEKAARLELGNEINNIRLTFETTKFVSPGDVIVVKNENLKINKNTHFFVEENTIIGTEKETDRYQLSCVPLSVYTAGEVESIFD